MSGQLFEITHSVLEKGSGGMVESLVSRCSSGVRLTTGVYHREMVSLALGKAVEAEFRRGVWKGHIRVVEEDGLRLVGDLSDRRVAINFYTNGVGVNDLSNPPHQEVLALINRILYALTESELCVGDPERSLLTFGKGALLDLGPEERFRAICLVYLAIWKQTRSRVARTVLEQLIRIYPEAASLRRLPLARVKALYEAASFCE